MRAGLRSKLIRQTVFSRCNKSAETTDQKQKKTMNTKFDELTKSMAQSVTRRGALKKFGVGLAGMALACFGLVPKSEGGKSLPPPPGYCQNNKDCAQYGPSAVCCNTAGVPYKVCITDKSLCV